MVFYPLHVKEIEFQSPISCHLSHYLWVSWIFLYSKDHLGVSRLKGGNKWPNPLIPHQQGAFWKKNQFFGIIFFLTSHVHTIQTFAIMMQPHFNISNSEFCILYYFLKNYIIFMIICRKMTHHCLTTPNFSKVHNFF